MKVAFISNFYNHHQAPFSEAMNELTRRNYRFIATAAIDDERLSMGWGEDAVPNFVMNANESAVVESDCHMWVDEADVVIIGSAPCSWIANRLKKGKLTFYYSERIYKKKCPIYKLPVHFLRHLKNIIRHKNLYILCASAYTASDYAKTFTFLNKAYKWGYFPELKKYDDINRLIEDKKKGSILWVSRYIDWKHPEIPVEVAKRLRDEGYDFELKMIGAGELFEQTKSAVAEAKLESVVKVLGPVKASEVRGYMEESEIFLFTSDRNEGWGAVLNESMNSACAVVANGAIGSVPFLLNDGENGYIYEDGNIDDLYNKVRLLLDNSDKCKGMAKNSYATIIDEWNAENAARKLIGLSEKMLAGEYKPFPYESGVCSKARIIKDNWYKKG